MADGKDIRTRIGNGGADWDSIWTGANSTFPFGRAAAEYGCHAFKRLVAGDDSGDPTKFRRIAMGTAAGASIEAQGEIKFNLTPNATGAGSWAGWKYTAQGAAGVPFGGRAANQANSTAPTLPPS